MPAKLFGWIRVFAGDDMPAPFTDPDGATTPGPVRTALRQDRRQFLGRVACGMAAGGLGSGWVRGADLEGVPVSGMAGGRQLYRGPHVILVRFGGGVRRRESIVERTTWAPHLCRELVPRGVLFPGMEIDQFRDLNTSHGEGTLHLLTGRYEKYRDIGETRGAPRKFLGARFEASVPTLFEYLRGAFAVPEHRALLVNGEDRGDEEFYNFSNHHLFGVSYRSQTLSLRRFKTWKLRRELAEGRIPAGEVEGKRKELRALESLDYRVEHAAENGAVLDRFWEHWMEAYGGSGRTHPRGDRLLTELSIRALRELQPALLMVNYQDCDYVHWGYLDHYTRAVAIMDQEIRRLLEELERLDAYRGNTVVVIVPDCGRDDNPFADVPCQHHFNTRSAHEIFALFLGAGVARGRRIERTVSQVDVATTLAGVMGFKATFAEGAVLGEVFA